MGQISKRLYRKSDMTKEWLLSNGFRYNRLFSSTDADVYTYKFPVYKYEKFTILECELKVILGESNVYIDVYDYNTLNKYAPFYCLGYGNYSKMLKEIWQKIDRELKRLGIITEEKKNGSKYNENKGKRCNPNKRK